MRNEFVYILEHWRDDNFEEVLRAATAELSWKLLQPLATDGCPLGFGWRKKRTLRVL